MTTQFKVSDIFQTVKNIGKIKGRIIRDIRDVFDQEKKDYYRPVRVGTFWSKSKYYIEYEKR